MKTIFLGEAASDSGSFGFSEACPLKSCCQLAVLHVSPTRLDLPSCPDRVHVHALRNIDNELHIGVVVVVRATWNLNVLISHSDVVGIGAQIFGRGHHSELDGPLVAERLVCPFSY